MDVSKFPLIRDILKNFPPSPTSTDSHPSSWLSDPAIMDAFRRNIPIGYMSQEKSLLDPNGQLLVWGIPMVPWKFCLVIRGLKWATLRTDLVDLFEGQDIFDPPIILGTAANFMALVYMRSLDACREVIADLNDAEIATETVLRVAFATTADLQRALEIQEQTLKSVPVEAKPQG